MHDYDLHDNEAQILRVLMKGHGLNEYETQILCTILVCTKVKIQFLIDSNARFWSAQK